MKKLIIIFCMWVLLSCGNQTKSDKREVVLNCESKLLIVKIEDTPYREIEFFQIAGNGELIKIYSPDGLYNGEKMSYWESIYSYDKIVCLEKVK